MWHTLFNVMFRFILNVSYAVCLFLPIKPYFACCGLYPIVIICLLVKFIWLYYLYLFNVYGLLGCVCILLWSLSGILCLPMWFFFVNVKRGRISSKGFMERATRIEGEIACSSKNFHGWHRKKGGGCGSIFYLMFWFWSDVSWF